ncbi:hypothetical protein XU18_0665 [Perkinsela sp. CCAP 1560/4]|nr:hypothetical protein XU18_0665 [Perkinsela sp. CCAP 1560/4]|eukprot:KNH08987.1 hypothetical protein XU18_0665 [Perkinsela sp. CCAP 1560/4]
MEDGTLGYIFACVFLFLSLAYYTLYSSAFTAKVITYFANKFFLDSKKNFYLGSIAFSPLRSRLLLKEVHFFDSNVGIRVCDMYITFNFWSRLFGKDSWRIPNASEKLIKGSTVRFKRRKEDAFTYGRVLKAEKEDTVMVQVSLSNGKQQSERIRKFSLQLRTGPGRLQFHLNGLEVFAYNNYNAYTSLKKMKESVSFADGESDAYPETQGRSVNDPLATILQPILSKRHITTFEKTMNFLRKVEFDVRTACISLGCIERNMPHCLNVSFSECIGSYFLTGGKFLGQDLYRQILDAIVYTAGIRLVPMDKAMFTDMQYITSRSTATNDRFKKLRSNFLDAANLLISGDQSAINGLEELDDEENLTEQHVLIDPKDLAALHVTWYKDEPGLETQVQTSLNINSLPRIGIVVEVDAKQISYGPFADTTRKLLKEHFFPSTYQPLASHRQQIGAPRSHGMFEVRVDFASHCEISVPFNHKADSPSLPFGTINSGKTGKLSLGIEKGSGGIFKFPLVLGVHEEVTTLRSYIHLRKVRVSTTLNDSNFLLSSSIDVHFDSYLPRLHESQRLMDVSVKLHGGEIWYLNDHVAFFQDMLNDFSHGDLSCSNAGCDSEWSYAHFFSDFVSQKSQFEIFFVESTKLYLNVNDSNIIYAKDHASSGVNSFFEAEFAYGEVRLCKDYHGYNIFKENEQKTHFRSNIEDLSISFRPSASYASTEESWFLKCNNTLVNGFYSIMLPNMSQPLQEYEKQQTQTNLSSGPAKFANVLKLSTNMDDATIALLPHHLQLFNVLKRNYFGDESSHVTPAEFPYFQYNGGNVKSFMAKFLTRNDFRRNDLECLIDFTLEKYQGSLRLGDISDAEPLKVVLTGGFVLYTLRSSIKALEQQISISPLLIYLQNEARICDHNARCYVQGLDVSFVQLLGAYPMQHPYQATLRCEVPDIVVNVDLLPLIVLLRKLRETRWVNFDSEITNLKSKSRIQKKTRRWLDSQIFRDTRALSGKTTTASVDPPSYLNPYEDWSVINHFREWYSQRWEKIQEANALCYILTQASIRHVTVSIGTSDRAFQAVVNLPQGCHVGYTTLHDGNTDARWSFVSSSVDLRLLTASTTASTDIPPIWRETCTLRTALFVRGSRGEALNSDLGLSKFTKQRTFMAANHMYYDFNRSSGQQSSVILEQMSRPDEENGHTDQYLTAMDMAKGSFPHTAKEIIRDSSGIISLPNLHRMSGNQAGPRRQKKWKQTSFFGNAESVDNMQANYVLDTPFVKFADGKPYGERKYSDSSTSGHKFMVSTLVPNNEYRERNNVSTVCYTVNFSQDASIFFAEDFPACVPNIVSVVQAHREDVENNPPQSAEPTSPAAEDNGLDFMAGQIRRVLILSVNIPIVAVNVRLPAIIGNRQDPFYMAKMTIRDFSFVGSAGQDGLDSSGLPRKFGFSARFGNLHFACSEVDPKGERTHTKPTEKLKGSDPATAIEVTVTNFQWRTKSSSNSKETHSVLFVPVVVSVGSAAFSLTQSSAAFAAAIVKYAAPMQKTTETHSMNDGAKNPFIQLLGVDCQIVFGVERVIVSNSPHNALLSGEERIGNTIVLDRMSARASYSSQCERMIAVVGVDGLFIRLYPDVLSLLAMMGHGKGKEVKPPQKIPGIHLQCNFNSCQIYFRSKRSDYIKLLGSNVNYVVGSNASASGAVQSAIEQLFSVDRLELHYCNGDKRSEESDMTNLSTHPSILQCATTNLTVALASSGTHGAVCNLGWTAFELEMPYRRDMIDVVIPHFKEYIHQWTNAIAQHAKPKAREDQADDSRRKLQLNCALQNVAFKARLANETEIAFSVAMLSGILASKEHWSRFRVFASEIVVATVGTAFSLPNVYFYQAHDSHRMAKSHIAIVDEWTTSITSEIFSNCLQMFRRFGVDLIEFITPILIHGSAEMVHTQYKGELWKLFFVGLDVSIRSAFASMIIKIGDLNFGLLRSTKPHFIRWFVGVPVIKLMLIDQLQVGYEEDDGVPSDSLHEMTGKLSENESESEGVRGISQRRQSEKSPQNGHFIWLQTTTSLRGSNFDEVSLVSQSVFEELSDEPFEQEGSDAEEEGSTQILHARLEVPAVQTLLRPGSLKVLLEVLNEYQHQWVEIEKEIQKERQVTSERLRENPLYKASQVSATHIVHSLMTKLSTQHVPINEEAEREWLLITSIFISRISFVVAFGDDLYNRVRAKKLRYICDHKDSRQHTHACLNEDFQYPLFTAKLYIDNIKLLDSVQFTSNSNGDYYSRIFSIEGKMLYCYMREVSGTESANAFENLLRSKSAIEYFGTARGDEFSKSSNRVHIPSFIIKGKGNAHKQARETVMAVHIGGPLITINMRLFFYLRDMHAEFSPFTFLNTAKKPKETAQKASCTRYSFNIAQGDLHVTSCVAFPSYFCSPAETNQSKSAFARFAGAQRKAENDMSSQAKDLTNNRKVFEITTPSVTGSILSTNSASTEIQYSSHFDVFLSQVKVNPSIVILSTEYAFLSSRWSEEKRKKNAALNTRQKVDRILNLLSFPHALRSHTLSVTGSYQSTASRRDAKHSSKKLVWSAHVSFLPLKLVISTDPFSTTSLVLAVDDTGSVDLLLSSTGDQFNIGLVCKKIRGEIQERMEVKSVECFIPCLTADFVMKRNRGIVNVNFLESNKESVDFIIRLTHLSQWYLIMELWYAKMQQAKSLSENLCQPESDPEVHAHHALQANELSTRKLFICILNFEKVTGCLVVGQTSKYDMRVGRASLWALVEYTSARDSARKLVHQMNIRSSRFALTDIYLHSEGHASGYACVDKTTYGQFHVCSPIDQHINEAMRRLRVVMPEFHAAFRERQVADAVQVDLSTTHFFFEDEVVVEESAQYNMFVECCVGRAYVFLSTALVSMIKAIQGEVVSTITSQRAIVQKFVEKHVASSMLTVSIAGSAQSAEQCSIPFMGSAMCVPPSGQIQCAVKDFAMTVGEATASQSSNVLLLVMDAFVLEFAQVRDGYNIQKACMIDVQNWNIFRTTAEHRSLIIGSSGDNTLQMETRQIIGASTVAYRFSSSFDKPWQGDPQLADFDLIARIIKAFSHLSSEPSHLTSAPQVRNYLAVSPGSFAPELRVTSDVVVNIDTLLSWAGMRQDTLPKHVDGIVTDLLEKLLSCLYRGLCPVSIYVSERKHVETLLNDETPRPSPQTPRKTESHTFEHSEA